MWENNLNGLIGLRIGRYRVDKGVYVLRTLIENHEKV